MLKVIEADARERQSPYDFRHIGFPGIWYFYRLSAEEIGLLVALIPFISMSSGQVEPLDWNVINKHVQISPAKFRGLMAGIVNKGAAKYDDAGNLWIATTNTHNEF